MSTEAFCICGAREWGGASHPCRRIAHLSPEEKTVVVRVASDVGWQQGETVAETIGEVPGPAWERFARAVLAPQPRRSAKLLFADHLQAYMEVEPSDELFRRLDR